MTPWQPIDTAPRDGTRVLLACGKVVRIGGWYHTQRFVNGSLSYENARWVIEGEGVLTALDPEPSLWAPIPDITDPAAAAADQTVRQSDPEQPGERDGRDR